MNNLAGVCKDLGQHDRAKELLEEALQRLTEKLGPTHLYTLVARNNLDELILELNLEEGISRLEATRDLLASHYPEHPFLYTCMYNVATGYFKGKRFDRSLSILENVLRLQQDHLSKDHPDTLRTKLILAANFRFVGRMDEARNLFEELVRLPEDDLHRSDRIYLNAASTLGLIYKDAGRRSEAIPLLEQGFRAWKLDPTLMTIGPVLIELYLQELPRDEAMRKIREVLQSCRDDSSQGTALATSLVGCGAKLLNSGEYLLAEELLREGQQLREKTAPDAWSTFNAKSLLGASLLGLGRYSEAEPLLKVGYEGMKSREKSIPPVARDRLPEAARRLVDLYDLTGNEPELRHWRSIWRTYCEPLAAPRELR
jgi:tetratricopeptide (TPR) repeat protein